MKSQVSIIKCRDYDYPQVLEAVRRAVNLLGGMAKFVKEGNKVLLKPNLLAPKPPETAVTTHPYIIKAVAELVKAEGGMPYIGDNPGTGNLNQVIAKLGLKDFVETGGMGVWKFDDYVETDACDGSIFKSFDIACRAFEADVVINLPKVKTHGMMILTLGVKNLFGFMSRQRRIQWHLKAGTDYDAFASMLIELYRLIDPDITIADGIIGMEGNGPRNGVPRKLGFIAASSDAIALDSIISETLGVASCKLYTNRIAAEKGIGEIDIARIEMLGDNLTNLRTDNFKLASLPSVHLEWGIKLPGFLRGYLKEHFTPKPIVIKGKCTLCGTCLDICPAQTISAGRKVVFFDYLKCIRCFCCQEMCPNGAIEVHHGLLLKVAGLFNQGLRRKEVCHYDKETFY